MIADLKKAMKMLKYGYQLKTNIVSAALIMILGIGCLCIADISIAGSSLYLVGALYFVLGPMFLLQIQTLMLYSHMVKSSPRARFLEIAFGDIFSLVISIVGYTIIVIYSIIKNNITPDAPFAPWLLATGLLIGVMQIYFSVVYKHFVLGTGFMLTGIIIVFMTITLLVEVNILGVITLNLTTAIILGYVAVIISLLLCALLRRMVYKHSFSKWACGAKLRKEL